VLVYSLLLQVILNAASRINSQLQPVVNAASNTAEALETTCTQYKTAVKVYARWVWLGTSCFVGALCSQDKLLQVEPQNSCGTMHVTLASQKLDLWIRQYKVHLLCRSHWNT
jgi:hypothetical protein